MKISDPTLLKMFGLSNKKGGYTPAEMSKKYDINKYRKILQDPDTDKIARKTAEIMIKNAVMKLGALALAQEGKKGFPQGIPEIAKPYMEANQIPEEDLVPKEETQQQQMPEDQMSEGEEGVGPGQEMLMNMPNGEPIAMPEEMPEASPEQMMQAPMAMYGMSMGGYDMPFYNNPNEMAYGGVPQYQPGGGKERVMTDAELEARRQKQKEIQKIKGTKCPEGYRLVNGFCQKGNITEAEREYKKEGKIGKGDVSKFDKAKWEASICDRLKKGATVDEIASAHGLNKSVIQSKWGHCIKQGAEKYNKEDYDVKQLEPETPEVTTPGKKCQCPDPMDETKWIDVECPEDGSEPDCGGEEEEVVDEEYAQQPESNPKWWLQDTVNTMGAFGDLMGTKKYMPWEARVDLEEPRPTFLDPTRELAAQSEQANIAAQASASFAGPQALGSRLSAIQGQGAGQAADTLSKINNQNVNIANQFEANQVGVRNQENMLNQQMTNRVFDKNVIANQQFDNAKRAGRAGLRTAYNTALTNRAKTDAMNQMYPNYQVDPSTGGMVDYTPTDKTLDPGEDEQSAREFADSLSGYTPEMQKLLFQQKYGKRYGGQMFEHGGYVYSTYPMMLL
jgi:hypothetical protein